MLCRNCGIRFFVIENVNAMTYARNTSMTRAVMLVPAE
jgi:hypothetical protein